MTLFIGLLGQPRLAVDTTPIPLSAPPKTLPLMAYLLLHCRQPVERRQVAFTLWPDETETAARANLRRHIHHLQRLLPETPPDRPWLLNTAGTIGWNPQSDFWLDVDEFQRLSRQADTNEEAVACYKGALLENVYDDWIFFDREQLHNSYLDILLKLILQYRAQRNHPRALELARKLLTCDPFREDVVRQLISIRYELGDSAGGIQEYRNFEQLLRREMGTTPMPETRALYDLIRRNLELPGTPPARPTSEIPTAQEISPSISTLPFVGRGIELEQALSWWARAARGNGSLALIGGETGIGKSRLAQELAQIVKNQGGRILYGIGGPLISEPYQPLIAALESALSFIAALKVGPLIQAALAPLLPELNQRLKLPLLPKLDPLQERMRMFDAVAHCLESLAEIRPLLLILEDLHKVEASTVELIEFLTRRLPHAGVLIVGIYREDAMPLSHPLRAMRRRLNAENQLQHLALGPLPLSAIEDLLHRLEAARQLTTPPRHLAKQIFDRSEGHPLFAELLLLHWQENRQMQLEQLPGEVHAVIQQRLAGLPELTRAYAGVAAISGSAFDAEVVREVGGWNENQTQQSLSLLLERHLIRDTQNRERFDYSFAHHLIQAALYEEIPPTKRRSRHLRIAQVLESLYPDRRSELIGELAWHYDHGNAPTAAVPCYLAVAQHHFQIYADQEALIALNRALELCAEFPVETDPRWQVNALLLREEIYRRRGERAPQLADLQQLESWACRLPDQELYYELLKRRILYCRAVDDRPTHQALLQELKTLAAQSGDLRRLAEAELAEGEYQILLGAGAEAQSHLQTALHFALQLNDAALLIAGYCALAGAEVQQGLFAEAQTALTQAGRLTEAQSNRSLIVATLKATSGSLFARQDFEGAQTLASQMLALSREIGDREGEADALARLGSVAARLFQVQEARRHYLEAARLYQKLGKRQGQAAVLINTCMLIVGRLGQYQEGLILTREAQALFSNLNDLRGQTVCWLNEGMITLYLEDYPASYAASYRGLELARQIESRVMEANALSNLGAAERELGRLDEAIAHMESGLMIRRELGQPAELGTDLCDLTVAYCRQGNFIAAKQSADEMLTLYAGLESSMMHPQYILWAAAQTYRGWGDEKRAHELLQQAYQVMQQRAAALPEAEYHATYHTLPFNRQIKAAWEENRWPG